MKIDKIPGVNPVETGRGSAGKNEANKAEKNRSNNSDNNVSNNENDKYLPGIRNSNKTTYDRPADRIDQKALDEIKKAADSAQNRLRALVKELLTRQGMTFEEAMASPEKVEVDEEAAAEAREMISEGGIYSSEAVSDRIVNFARAISGDDTEKYDLLREAIDKGFDEARRILGGSLPEVSETTYDLVMEKLDHWASESEQTNEQNG
ncbi:hypothetical protein [Halarsenatibacter silvermanii]|uniref:DUF5610 domain-containing protein n=1 Tax=Halarsenatibacter silvermanii TaxID=321763 RepID=A0A1G9LVH7_9FIRM|nr:hypothetical protein [Halarsenatibacter silvermanii]SDL65956.1 hypothetical protein SAMN04488692_10723 [Halarsenatibacter silvermanii]